MNKFTYTRLTKEEESCYVRLIEKYFDGTPSRFEESARKSFSILKKKFPRLNRFVHVV